MPTYNYQCNQCKTIWDELWLSFDEAEKFEPEYLQNHKCANCGSTDKVRLLSPPMITFKGEGWTNKTIGPSDGRRDSTGALKEEAERLRSEAKSWTSKDVYGM